MPLGVPRGSGSASPYNVFAGLQGLSAFTVDALLGKELFVKLPVYASLVRNWTKRCEVLGGVEGWWALLAIANLPLRGALCQLRTHVIGWRTPVS